MKKRYKRAVGLHYAGGMDSTPELSIKGEEYLADEIVKVAERFGVPVIERPELVQALSQLEMDQEIPEHLFEAVAILLSELERIFPAA